jgi:hypothetical protein
MKENRIGFLGTYFNKDAVLRLSRASKILAWIVLVVYGFQLFLSIGVYVQQILRGFWAGMSFPDIVQNFLYSFEQPLHGVVYFFALLGISQLLLVFLDIEDNTRQAARRVAGTKKWSVLHPLRFWK